jgi:hypothetical protein
MDKNVPAATDTPVKIEELLETVSFAVRIEAIWREPS